MTKYNLFKIPGYVTRTGTMRAGTISFVVEAAGSYLFELVGGGGGSGSYDAMYYGGWSNWQCACGISSGCNLMAAINLDKKAYANKIVVTVLPDNGTIGGAGASVRPRGWSGAGGNSVLYRNNRAIVTAAGGSGCENAAYRGANYTGQGGAVTINQPSLVTRTLISRRGNNGGYGTGNRYAPSVYDGGNYGYGAGGDAWADGDDHAWANGGQAGFGRWTASIVQHKCYKILTNDGFRFLRKYKEQTEA